MGAISFSEKLMPFWIWRKKFSPEMLVLFYRIIALKTETAGTSKDRIFHIKICCVTTQQTAILIFPLVAHWLTLKLASNCRGIQPVSDSDNTSIWHRPCKLFHASLSSAVRGGVCQEVSVRWGRSCMVSPTSWLTDQWWPLAPPPHKKNTAHIGSDLRVMSHSVITTYSIPVTFVKVKPNLSLP